ncbi:putative c6 zinc finger domain-containing protein [Diplodia seriata]|uniref:Putative c6 zinc finger domain-containing protein n=1 Tax=Diplodia seriata TaxID=420778 RepID=A0A0G2GEG1_9PEZI|nr:putative c6 zinc finger domain-containing protein [Diplodia seriata]
MRVSWVRLIVRRQPVTLTYLASLEDINRKLPWPCLDDAAGPAFTAEDMQLLHHFSTETYATLDTAPGQHAVWQRTAIRIGFKHRFVLRGLLAIAALHLACGSSADDPRSSWIASSSVNFNQALIEFRQVLGASGSNNENNTIDDNNDQSAAVFLFATTVVVHALAIGQTQYCVDPVADMTQCVRTVRGTASVVRPSWEALLASDVAPLALNGIMQRRGDTTTITTNDDNGPGAADDVLALKQLVQAGSPHCYAAASLLLPPLGEDEAAAYARAIDHLHDVAREARARPAGSAVLAVAFIWPVLLDDAFLLYLAERRPVAVIVLLNFTALLERCCGGAGGGGVWWLAGWHRRARDFAEISSLLPPALMKWVPE